jgi:uncharacterized membrane protein YedE/YeeE
VKSLRRHGVPFLSGLLFAAGLVGGGMTRPGKVVAFLDVTGSWDPSLALVMVGAIAVYSAAYWGSRRLSRPVVSNTFFIPTRSPVDARLVVGSMIFGVGWGMLGYCPGPALVSSASGAAQPLVFTATMLLAFWLTRRLDGRIQRRTLGESPPRG